MKKPAKPRKSAPEGDGRPAREAILTAALTAFAREGYDGASMPRIARMANSAPPLVHYYFGTKENLWKETVDLSLGELRREAAAICAATRALAPLDRLRALLQAHCEFAAKWPDHFFMIISEARSDSERFAWVQENYTGVLFEQVLGILGDARAAGAIRDVDLEQIAIMLVGGILIYFTVLPQADAGSSKKRSADDYCRTMFEVLLNGVSAQGRP